MLRTLQSTAITIFFLVMMFFLFRDHVIPNWNRGGGIDVDRSVLTDSWANQDEWLAVRLDEMELGGIRTTAEYEEEGDYYTATAHVEVRTPILRGRILTAARMNHRLEMQSARIRAHIPGLGRQPLSGEALDAEELPPDVYELIALVEGNALHFRLRHDDAVQYDTIRLARPVTLADSLTPIYRGQMLTEGVTYAADLYDPLWGSKAGKVEIEYLGDTAETIRGEDYYLKQIEMRFPAMNTRSRLLVDQNGTVMRREIPLFASATSTAPGSYTEGGVLYMERMEPAVGSQEFTSLTYVPAIPEVTKEDVTGQNRGEVLKKISVFSLVTGRLGNRE